MRVEWPISIISFCHGIHCPAPTASRKRRTGNPDARIARGAQYLERRPMGREARMVAVGPRGVGGGRHRVGVRPSCSERAARERRPTSGRRSLRTCRCTWTCSIRTSRILYRRTPSRRSSFGARSRAGVTAPRPKSAARSTGGPRAGGVSNVGLWDVRPGHASELEAGAQARFGSHDGRWQGCEPAVQGRHGRFRQLPVAGPWIRLRRYLLSGYANQFSTLRLAKPAKSPVLRVIKVKSFIFAIAAIWPSA